ncbi:MAG: hypothetical protein E7580_02775 [Ruminococcaceae bacterium]|nr:hypothetical protein [Oscillospiraceae bacterium]
MEEKTVKWMERLPYPVLALAKNGKILHRNRLAKGLLPSLSKLREILPSNSFDGDFLQEMRLDGIAYLVVRLAERDGGCLLCFFEHFLPLQEGLSRAILGKMQDFFWTLFEKEGMESFGKNGAYLDQIAARACSLRRSGDDYLRLLSNRDSFCEEKKICSLSGFFNYLQRALDAMGIRASFRFPEHVNVLSEGEVLSYLVLNLIHFARLYEGESFVFLDVTEEGDHLRFSVEFSDGGGVASSLETLIRCGKEDEKLLCTLPMLCVLRICLDKGIPWTAERRDEKIRFSFLLSKGKEAPVLFLSDATAAEVAKLLQMVKNIFS